MAVLFLHIKNSTDVGVKDLVIHSAAYYSCSTAVGLYILSPQHDDGGVLWNVFIFLPNMKVVQ